MSHVARNASVSDILQFNFSYCTHISPSLSRPSLSSPPLSSFAMSSPSMYSPAISAFPFELRVRYRRKKVNVRNLISWGELVLDTNSEGTIGVTHANG